MSVAAGVSLFKLTTIFLVIFVIASIKNLSFTESDGTPVQAHTAMIEIKGTIEASGNASAGQHHQGSEQGL